MAGCNCPTNDPEDPNVGAYMNNAQQQYFDSPSLMVSPEQNQFAARGYSLCYEDVFRVIAETRRNGISVVSR